MEAKRMSMIPSSSRTKQIPLNMVGSSVFGQYPKISTEETTNMYISDGFLVPYPGYFSLFAVGTGLTRGIYYSTRANSTFVVVGGSAFIIQNNVARFIGSMGLNAGFVQIDEDIVGNVVFCEINFILSFYNYNTLVFGRVATSFTPTWVCYINQRFLCTIFRSSQWIASDVTQPGVINFTYPGPLVGQLATAADTATAIVRYPGRGNAFLILGKFTSELWYDVGAPVFPFQKNINSSYAFGILDARTLSSIDNFIAFVALNNYSNVVIMATDGNEIKKISIDGLNFIVDLFTSNAWGNIFRVSGHTFYQLNWPDSNYSIVYDFTTGKFFNLTDPNGNMYPVAKSVLPYANQPTVEPTAFNSIFITFNDNVIYTLSEIFYTGNGATLPRSRTLANIRLPDASRFVLNSVSFAMEQGINQVPGNVQLFVSKDGGYTYSANAITRNLQPQGSIANRVPFWNLGSSNDFVLNFNFTAPGRFVIGDGVASIYQ
jgi:hypothetical protein